MKAASYSSPRSRATSGTVGSTIASIRCSANQSTQFAVSFRGAGALGASTYSLAEKARRSPMLEKVLASTAGSDSLLVEAAVVRQHLGAEEDRSAQAPGPARLPAAARLRQAGARMRSNLGEVRVELADPRRHGHTPQRPALRRGRRAAHRREQRLAVGHRPRHRPGVVEGRASGTMPRRGTRPRVGLIVDVPHMRKGCAATRPCPSPSRPAACARRAPPPSRRSTRPPTRERPRVADLIGRAPAANSCVCRWPSRTMPLRGQPRPYVAVPGRHLVEDGARRRQRLAGDGVQVLEPDGDAAERRSSPVASRSSAREAPVRASSA